MNIKSVCKSAFVVLLAGSLLVSCGKKNKAVKLVTENDSLSYCIGVSTGMYFKQIGLDTVNQELIAQAINSIVKKDSASIVIPVDKAQMFLQNYFQKKERKKYEGKITEGQKFFEENKKKPGIVTTPSGLQYKIETEGKGEMPKITDKVKVHYKGSFLNGQVFESSYDTQKPVEFPVGQVIPGWTEGLQLMKVGAKYTLYIPYNLAYGEQGRGRIEPYAGLIFEVELLEILKESDKKDTKK